MEEEMEEGEVCTKDMRPLVQSQAAARSDYDVVKRPGMGRDGFAVKIIANHFKMRFGSDEGRVLEKKQKQQQRKPGKNKKKRHKVDSLRSAGGGDASGMCTDSHAAGGSTMDDVVYMYHIEVLGSSERRSPKGGGTGVKAEYKSLPPRSVTSDVVQAFVERHLDAENAHTWCYDGAHIFFSKTVLNLPSPNASSRTKAKTKTAAAAAVKSTEHTSSAAGLHIDVNAVQEDSARRDACEEKKADDEDVDDEKENKDGVLASESAEMATSGCNTKAILVEPDGTAYVPVKAAFSTLTLQPSNPNPAPQQAQQTNEGAPAGEVGSVPSRKKNNNNIGTLVSPKAPPVLKGGEGGASVQYQVIVHGRDYAVRISKDYVSRLSLRAEVDNYVSGRTVVLPAAALMAIDVIIKHDRGMDPRFISVGRSFLDSMRRSSLGMGYEVWLGYDTSARPTEQGLSLVIDRAAASFVKGGPAINLLCEIYGVRSPRDLNVRQLVRSREFVDANELFRGIKFETTHIPGSKRAHRASGLSTKSARDIVFSSESVGGKVSVLEYFSQLYDITLAYPDLPCVRVSKQDKEIFFPLEMCNVLPGKKKLVGSDVVTKQLTAKQLMQTRSMPRDRIVELQRTMARSESDPFASLVRFGITIDSAPTKLEARVLQQAVLSYSADTTVTPRNGTWNLQNMRALRAASMSSTQQWAVLNFANCPQNEVEVFVHALQKGMREFGGSISAPHFPERGYAPKWQANDKNSASRLEKWLHAILNAGEGKPSRFSWLLCIVGPDPHEYNALKFLLDSIFGVISQCVTAKTVRGRGGGGRGHSGRGGGGGGPDRSTIANILLKINTKLGGVNAAVAHRQPASSAFKEPLPCISDVPTIVIGVDVSHPPAGTNEPSIAAAAGTIDGQCVRFSTEVSLQPPRTEIISDLGAITVPLLRRFEAHTRKKPERIILFRDGIGEGNRDIFLSEELPNMMEAIGKLHDGYRPKITVIIVSKRHKTRVFLDRESEKDASRSGNVPSGTVIDSAIVDPYLFDFYLVSHDSPIGTSRPIHYHCYIDENRFGVDKIQALCFRLSFLFCRCTKAISIVPPIAYADAVADRERRRLSAKNAMASKRVTKVHSNLKSTMYFV